MNKYKTKKLNSQVGTIKSNFLIFLKIINVKLVKFYRNPDFPNSILNTKISLSNYNSKTFTYYLEQYARVYFADFLVKFLRCNFLLCNNLRKFSQNRKRGLLNSTGLWDNTICKYSNNIRLRCEL